MFKNLSNTCNLLSIYVQTPLKLVQTRSKTLNFHVFPFLHLTFQAFCPNACPEQALRVERIVLAHFFFKSPKNQMSNFIFSLIQNPKSKIQNLISRPQQAAKARQRRAKSKGSNSLLIY